MRWQVQLQGGKTDIALLRHNRPEWSIVQDGESWFLGHPDLDRCADADEARLQAERIVASANQTLVAAEANYSSVQIGTVVKELKKDGSVNKHAMISGTAKLRLEAMPANVLVDGRRVGGRLLSTRMAELADTNTEFAAAIARFETAGTDYSELYVVREHILVGVVGGNKNWHKLVEMGWASAEEFGSFRETANKRGPRHRPVEGPKKYPAMSPSNAREFVRKLLVAWTNLEIPN